MVEENLSKRTAGKWSLFLIHIFAMLFVVRTCGFSPCSYNAMYGGREESLLCSHDGAFEQMPCKHGVCLGMCSSQRGMGKGYLQVNELVWSSGNLKTPATTQTKFDFWHFDACLQKLFVPWSGKL